MEFSSSRVYWVLALNLRWSSETPKWHSSSQVIVGACGPQFIWSPGQFLSKGVSIGTWTHAQVIFPVIKHTVFLMIGETFLLVSWLVDWGEKSTSLAYMSICMLAPATRVWLQHYSPTHWWTEIFHVSKHLYGNIWLYILCGKRDSLRYGLTVTHVE